MGIVLKKSRLKENVLPAILKEKVFQTFLKEKI
jgi:hypothetical protein